LQLAAAAVEAGARGLVGKEIAVRGPCAQQPGLLAPAFALADQRHRHQFGIGTRRLRTGAVIPQGKLTPAIVDEHVRPQTKIFKARYHRGGSPSGSGGVKHRTRTRWETLFSTQSN
jgi:hypothetical protein